MKFDLAELAEAVGSPRRPSRDAAVWKWSIDSRTIEPGAVFFALKGPNHDGHDHLEEVFGKGAAAAVVERSDAAADALIPVADTLKALQDAASRARGRYRGQMIAVTGSAGKTTTKEVIAHLLSAGMPVGKNDGNLNNHVGLPLSILRMPEDTRAAVMEIGMNHAGEIRTLAGIARPDVAVVTNVGYAHIENFESIDGIALAKRELVEALPPEGAAVLNADDPRVCRFREIHPGPVILFGIDAEAEVRAEDVVYSPDGVRFRVNGEIFESSMAGRHAVLNILAGLAVARLFGIPIARLRDAARSLTAGKMRGERFDHNGITVWNDCYNSNPDAARSMLDVLRRTPARRRIAVLGEMLELGRWSEPLHRDVGSYAAGCGISVLVGIRGAARHMVDEAMRAGVAADAAYFFEDPAEAGELVRQLAGEGDAVLFKGSRGTRVERALERFIG